ncbi:MAG: AAA family ATPase [Alphaproteobacteria bacterium]|nr:AAA family ATPase [Alphaproteobacteria bacterium]
MDVEAWLRELGLERYTEAFQGNDIDAEILPDLNDTDLEKLGVASVGHRKKLLKAIAALAVPEPQTPAAPPQADVPSGPAKAQVSFQSEADRRQLTVLFCDLVGSTELSTRFDPEDMLAIIRAYQDCCTSLIVRFDGFVARFMGDGILAYFGFPRAHEDDGERAVRTGLAIADAVSKLTTPTGEPLSARIGMATGLVVVGDLIGEGTAQEQTVVGETPNLAARLQELADPGSVVISSQTRQLLGDLFELDDLGSHSLKGLAVPVNAWKVIGEGEAESRFDALHSAALTPMIGREAERNLLLSRWQRAKEGEGQVVVLSGEPGIGKSRLTQDLREQLAEEPHTRLSYHCSPYHTNSALHPVVDQLRRAADILSDDPPEQQLDKLKTVIGPAGGQMSNLVPLLAALCAVPTGEAYAPLELTPQAQRLLTLEALMVQLESLAELQPVVLIVEDVHWIDPTTAELTALTVERIQHLPVLVLVTSRPGFTAPWVSRSHVTTLALNRLVSGQGAEIVEGLTGGRKLPQNVMEQILVKTDGIPLFVEELTKVVLESGLLTSNGEGYRQDGALPPLAIPATLHDSLMARLDRLAPVKDVAQSCAAIGREFSYRLIAAVSSLEAAELEDALDQLEAAELVFHRGTPPDANYIFKHALVQDAAYQSLLLSRRQQLHARIAEVLEGEFPQIVDIEPELLAHHLTQAGIADKAAKYWHIAGQLSLAHSGTAEALAHLEQGLDVLKNTGDDPLVRQLELDLQLTLAGALAAARGHGVQETCDAYTRAVTLARELHQPDALFPALDGLITFRFSRAEISEAVKLGEEFLQLAEDEDDEAARIVGHMNLGVIHLSRGMLEIAESQFQSVLALYDAERHASLKFTYAYDPKVICSGYLAWAQLAQGRPDDALEASRQSVAFAKDLSHALSLGFALHRSAAVHQLRRDVEAAEATAAEMGALADKQGFATYRAQARLYQGWATVQRGSADEGAELLTESLDDLRTIKDEDFFPHSMCMVAEGLIAQGKLDQALAVLNQAKQRTIDNEEHWFEAEVHRLIGEVCAAQTQAAEAEKALLHSLELAREQKGALWELRAAVSLATLWVGEGRGGEAKELLTPICARFSQGLDTPDLMEAKALLEG